MAISLSKNKHTSPRTKARLHRQVRGRKKLRGTAERPRLVVTRSRPLPYFSSITRVSKLSPFRTVQSRM